jgi:hypothetical protein
MLVGKLKYRLRSILLKRGGALNNFCSSGVKIAKRAMNKSGRKIIRMISEEKEKDNKNEKNCGSVLVKFSREGDTASRSLQYRKKR